MNLFANVVGISGEEIPENIIGKRLAVSKKFARKPIQHDILADALIQAGLEQFVPKKPSAVDIFRRACQDISKGYIQDNSNEKKYKLNVILVDESGDPVIRTVQITEVDKQEKESTDGIVIAELKFHREEKLFIINYKDTHNRFPWFAVQKIEEARGKYYELRDTVSDSQLSNILSRILLTLGTPVREIPSLWTVPAAESRLEQLQRLVSFMDTYNRYEEIFFYDILPIVRAEDVAKKVKTDAIHYALEAFNRKFEEIQRAVALAKNPSDVGERNIRSLETETEEIMTLIREYETVLGEAMDEVRQARNIVLARAREFVNSPQKQAEYREKAGRVMRTKNQERPANIEGAEIPAGTPKRVLRA